MVLPQAQRQCGDILLVVSHVSARTSNRIWARERLGGYIYDHYDISTV